MPNERDEAIEMLQKHLNEFEAKAKAHVAEVSKAVGAFTAYSSALAGGALGRV